MIHIGVDYYPEHWPREMWPDDIAKMKAAGVTTVRIAEFTWGLMEPHEGEFHFDWLDDIVRQLGDAGLEIILGTPTNCAPLWMYRDYPDTLQCEKDGNPTFTGIRGHRCYESPRFRKYAARIIGEMTKRYANDPHVIAWQIDNEPDANHCNCPECTAKFRAFLQNKYKSLDEMNHAWGTDVWSGEITRWQDITTPKGPLYSPNWLNPGYLLDYERFAAKSTADYVRWQYTLLRQAVPETVSITTNACFCGHTIDFRQTFAPLDLVSYDNYPEVRIPEDEEAVYSTAPALDLMRGVKQKNFWIMEQLSGPKGCWGPMSETTRPGMIEGYGLQDVAHGADMVLQFRWRSAARGAEMYWHGLIDQSNVPGRRFAEFEKLCARVKELDWLEGTTPRAEVAILYGAEQLDAFGIQTQSPGLDYWPQLRAWHEAFTSYGVNVDVIDEAVPLDRYRVVVVPCHFITNEKTVAHINAFVRAGGTAVITNRSGVKDAANGCVMQALPGAFADVCGVTVREYDPIGERTVRVRMGESACEGNLWADLLTPSTAETIAVYDSEFYKGTPAITCNACGSGHAYYMGVCGKRALRRAVAKDVLETADVAHTELPRGVQMTTRESDTVKARFLFNENETARTFSVNGEAITLNPFEMRIDKID